MTAWDLIAGNSLAVLQTLETDSVDTLITDPPYSSGGRTAGERTRQTTGAKYVQTGTKTVRPDFVGDNRDQRSYLAWSALWLAEALRVSKPGGDRRGVHRLASTPHHDRRAPGRGMGLGGIVVWDKGAAARPYSARGGFRPQSEYVVWGSNGPLAPTVNLPGVLRHSVRQTDKHHQTGKPTDLMRDLVRICPVDGLVLDPFAGSGTTGVACQLEQRRFIGIELTDDYAAIARRRLEEGASPP